MKLTPEKQAERDQVFSKIYAELPPEDKVRIDHIRAEGTEQIEDQRVEFDALITRLIAGNCRFIPVTELAWCAAIAARKAEPVESRKDLAAYESGRAFIRAIKAALLEGSLTTREQGSGIPINDKSWCLANDTLLSLPAMMPHDRLMLQTDEAMAWLKKMGIAIDAFPVLHLANKDITRVKLAPTGDQPEKTTRRKRSNFIGDALDEALEAIPEGSHRELWRWIITNIRKWPELTYDAAKNELRGGRKNPTDFAAFEARVRTRRKFNPLRLADD